MKEYFNTAEEAEEYKQKHELYQRTVEYIPCKGKYALIFKIKAQVKGD